MAGRALKFHPN